MKNIKEIVVVEGKTDSSKLKSLFPSIETFETHGNKISKKMLMALKLINDQRGIICFLDPDGAGKAIRQKIIDYIPNCKHAFINKNSIKKDMKKIGIAEAENQAIIDALNQLISFEDHHDSINWQQYLQLNLDSKMKRKLVCDHFKICEYNHKQLFKILNYMNVNYNQVFIILNS